MISLTTQVTLKNGEHCIEDVRGQTAQGLNSVPMSKYRESQPIPKTKVLNEISREQETTFPRELAVILVICLQELSRKNGPTEVSLMKNDDADRAKSGSLLQRLTSRNLVVTALIANSRAKKQNYSNAENRLAKSKIGGPPLLPLSRYTVFKSGENQNPDLTKKWSYKKNGSF